MSDPLLAFATDGCGTKLKIAQELNVHDTIGIDLVAMCVNDLLCTGAQPLTFLDYYACGKLNVNTMVSVVKGVCDGCVNSKSVLLGIVNLFFFRNVNSIFVLWLLGGETAEMPGVYEDDTYDLAGFALGIVDRKKILPNIDQIETGDLLIGIPSSGLHSNGYSLVHKLLETQNIKLKDKCIFDGIVTSIGQKLLVPTEIYVECLKPLIELQKIKALAHITGGGLPENVCRVLPKHLGVRINFDTFQTPEIFSWIASKGNVNNDEMFRTFNCGIGIVLIVTPESENFVLETLKHQKAQKIGQVVSRNVSSPQVTVVNEFEKFYNRRKRVAVLISGNGSNLQALIDGSKSSHFGMNADITLVISNKADAYGVERAKLANIPCVVIKHKDFENREAFDEAISNELSNFSIDVVCLAGFMRILSPTFIKKWKGKLINIHPSLLPKFPGLNAQRQALEAKETYSGCTVHFVDEGVDTGAIILQETVPVFANDTVETLSDRIHIAEHKGYPKALKLLANGIISEN